MKTKHTKGKWEIWNNGHNGIRIMVDKDNPLKSINICTLSGSCTDKEVQANAKIIAATPELLKELQNITGVLLSLHLIGIKLPEDCEEAINTSISAIKKATE